MTRPFHVLVFPCGSEIGLEIFHALKSCTHVRLFGASSVSSNHGRYVFANYLEGLPFAGARGFVAALNRLIDRHRIDMVFPGHDEVVLRLAESRKRVHCAVIGSPVKTCRICRSKRRTYEYYADVLRVPMIYALGDRNVQYPLFLKPDIGQGSRGVLMAHSRVEVEFHLRRQPELLALEYLPGKEYTVDCFTDRNGSLRFVGGRERIRIMNGISVHTKPVDNPEFVRIAQIIHERQTFRGAWFFQLKEDRHGQLGLLEIAPRVAGAMGLFRNQGVNLPLLSVYDAAGLDVDIIQNRMTLEMDRALVARFDADLEYHHVYIDLDDTILEKGKVNPFIIAFLYQCRNRGIQLHLITRNRADLSRLLKQFRLPKHLFDSVLQLGEKEKKSQYIRQKDSIFIDDSFAERRDVLAAAGVPVFAADAIECLLDWKR